MNRGNLRRLLGVCLLLSVAMLAFSQGLYWETTATGGPLGDKVNYSKSYVMPKMFKHQGDKSIVIVRSDKEMVYTLNPEEKTYTEITFAEMEAWAKKASTRMDSSRATALEKMKNLPEEQRKRMEQMMGGLMQGQSKDAKVEVTNTGEKKTVSGYPCTKYIVKQDGKDVSTLWVTREVKGFESVRKDWENLSKRLMSLNRMTAMVEAYQKIEGFPMETEVMQMTATVTKVEKKSVPASEFEIPAGYTKTKSKLTGE